MAEIKLSGEAGRGMVALVDDEQYERLSGQSWYWDGRYVAGWEKGRGKRLHRAVLEAPVGKEIDHINGNTLDNRRSNLRVCTKAENHYNRGGNLGSTSVFKGVTWHARSGKWQAAIAKKVDGVMRHYYLGLFPDEAEAARAYDARALELFGEYARLNFGKERA